MCGRFSRTTVWELMLSVVFYCGVRESIYVCISRICGALGEKYSTLVCTYMYYLLNSLLFSDQKLNERELACFRKLFCVK